MAFLLLAATTFLGWGPASSRGAFAETVPQALRANIHVRKVLVTEGASSPPVRIAKDPRNSTLYYLKLSGDIYHVVAGTSKFVADAADHG